MGGGCSQSGGGRFGVWIATGNRTRQTLLKLTHLLYVMGRLLWCGGLKGALVSHHGRHGLLVIPASHGSLDLLKARLGLGRCHCGWRGSAARGVSCCCSWLSGGRGRGRLRTLLATAADDAQARQEKAQGR